MRVTMMKLFNLLLSPIGRVASWPMRNIATFPSMQMYLYLSLVERKVAEFYHNIDRRSWLVWVKMTYFHCFFRTIPGVLDNLLHYSAYTPKKSAFYANWFGNAKQLNEKWKILKEIHVFNSASAFFQLWLRMCFSKNPFPCVPFLWKNQLQFPSC